MIRLTRPYFDGAEAEAVTRVLASGMLVQGPTVADFEARVAAYLGGAAGDVHAVAVSNGTTALELALAALDEAGVGPGDEVVLGALTWPSPGHAVLLRGATPVLVDICPTTWNAPPRALARALSPRTKAVIAIDQFGVPAEIPALRALCPADVTLVEDAACALGSSLDGVPCGLLGDLATFSFHPRKVITTGEGGMVVTRDAHRAARLRTLRNHGQRAPGDFERAGPNARMAETQAALGVAQMVKLDDILSRRRTLAETLRAAVPLAWQGAPAGATVNHQTAGLVLPPPASGPHQGDRRAARDALVAALRADGVEAGALSYALHRLPAFVRAGAPARLPITEAVVDGGLAVPLHPGMTGADLDAVIDALRRHAAWAFGRGAALAEVAV